MNPYLFFGFFVAATVVLVAWLASHFAAASLLTSVLLGVNAAAFVSLGFDKGFARAGAKRVPEIVFLILALVGGTPGVILGTHLLKHKNRKAYFQFVVLLIVVAQLLVARLCGLSLVR